jgi:predicted protein tyrosine phosphatase
MLSQVERRPKQNPRTSARLFEDEAVVIDPRTNMARMFNAVGSRIWELSTGDRTIADIASILETEYTISKEEALQSVTDFVEELARRDLVLL